MISVNDVNMLLDTYNCMVDANTKKRLSFVVRAATNEFLGFQPRKRATVPLTQNEIEALRDGQKITAVKLVKERLNIGLIDAKHYVEEHMGPYYGPQSAF